MSTGKYIKAARVKAGMTQAELAKKLGVTPQNISQYEREAKNPKYETLQKIADALNCSVFSLKYGTYPNVNEEAAARVCIVFNTNDFYIKKAALASSAYTESIYHEKGYSFSEAESDIVKRFNRLGKEGQRAAIERIEELTRIPEYQKKEEDEE